MLKKIKESKQTISHILSLKNYFILFILVGIVSFIVLYELTLATITDQDLGILIMMLGFKNTFIEIIALLIISLLIGLFISLITYKIRLTQETAKSGIIGSIGIIVGFFSAGCPTCGAFLFGLVGFPLALMAFPFRGLELKVLSIILMFVSIYFLSAGITKCRLKSKTKNE